MRPIPPPTIEKLNKKDSDNLHLFLTAYDLSNIIIKQAKILIRIKIVVNNLKSINPPKQIVYIIIYILS